MNPNPVPGLIYRLRGAWGPPERVVDSVSNGWITWKTPVPGGLPLPSPLDWIDRDDVTCCGVAVGVEHVMLGQRRRHDGRVCTVMAVLGEVRDGIYVDVHYDGDTCTYARPASTIAACPLDLSIPPYDVAEFVAEIRSGRCVAVSSPAPASPEPPTRARC